MHLSDYMRKKNLKDEEVAAAIRRSRPTVSRIRRKLVRPDWDTIRNIEKFTGGVVTASDFTHIEAVAAE
jgi:transcriptional regulator with XRE-family HTH domain